MIPTWKPSGISSDFLKPSSRWICASHLSRLVVLFQSSLNSWKLLSLSWFKESVVCTPMVVGAVDLPSRLSWFACWVSCSSQTDTSAARLLREPSLVLAVVSSSTCMSLRLWRRSRWVWSAGRYTLAFTSSSAASSSISISLSVCVDIIPGSGLSFRTGKEM